MTTSARLSRRSLLAGAGLGLGALAAGSLTACASGPAASSASGATTKLRITLGWISNVEFGGYFIADDRGYYAEEGLEIEFLPGGANAPSASQSLAAGNADIGLSPSMSDTIVAAAKGNDLQILGAVFQDSPGGIVSLTKKPITTPKELAGAKVLGQTGTQPYLDAILELADLPPATYDFVPAGFDPSPLVDGQGDAYTCYVTNQPTTLETQFGLVKDEDYVTVTYSRLGLPSYADVIVSTGAFAKANEEAVVKFLRASVRGWQDNVSDPAIAAKLCVEKYGADLGLDLDQQIRQNELQIPLIQSDFTAANGLLNIDTELLNAKMLPAMKAAGQEPVPANVDGIVDLSYITKAFDGKITL
jgi:ABC-type nitrate/sulfonate/bicarbonate transport system substrate-binding protein